MFVTKVLPLILGSLVIAVFGQLALKIAMGRVTAALPQDAGPASVLLKAATSPLVIVGLAGYVISAALWLLVLSRAELSQVYPFAGLTIVIVTLAAGLFLGERVTSLRFLGMLLVFAGVTLVARS